MAEFLVIRPGSGERASQWVRVDSSGTQKSRLEEGSLQQAAAAAANVPVIGLLPASQVLTTTATIPARSASRIRAALPYALEETLADDIDDLHFASGPRTESGSVPVAVIAKSDLDNWLATFRTAGIEPAKLVAETQGLARVPGTMSLLVDERSCLFNDGSQLEFSLPDATPTDVLVAAGKLGDTDDGDNSGDEQDAGHLLVFCDADAEERLQHEWIALRHELGSVDVSVLRDGALPKLAVTVASGNGINLLQGAYGKAPEYRAMLRPWKVAASLLLGLLLLTGGATILDLFQKQRELGALQEQFAAEYRLVRPNDARTIVDPANIVRSLQRSIGAGSAPPVFLQSIGALSAAVNGDDDISIEQISYRAGVVDIRLLAPSIPAIDTIRQRVSEGGQFTAEIRSTDRVGELIDGRLQIRESGS